MKKIFALLSISLVACSKPKADTQIQEGRSSLEIDHSEDLTITGIDDTFQPIGYSDTSINGLFDGSPYDLYLFLQRREDATGLSYGSYFETGISSVNNEINGPLIHSIDLLTDTVTDSILQLHQKFLEKERIRRALEFWKEFDSIYDRNNK